jgi:PAS domain S-box-containing protein
MTRMTDGHGAREEMDSSDLTFRDVLESIADVVFSTGLDGIVTYVNSAVRAATGYSPEEIVGRHIGTFLSSEDLPRFGSACHQVLAGEPQEDDYQIVIKDGERRWMRTASRPVVENGRVVGVTGVVTDISERKQAENALRASEARYRAVVEGQTEMVCRFRPDGVITFSNEAYCRYRRSKLQDIVGQSFLALMPDEGRDWYVKLFASLTEQDPVVTVERKAMLSGDSSMWLQWTFRGIFDQGQMVELQAVGRDITERKQAQQALAESEDRWRSLVQNAPDTVMTVDRSGRILFMNRVPEGVTLSVSDVVGTYCTDYAPPEQRDVLARAIASIFDGSESADYEYAVPAANGRSRWFSARLGPIRRGGEVVAAILLTRDITEQKQIEETKDNLIREVSHELRTPLAKVQMGLDLLLEMLDQEEMDRGRARRTGEMLRRNVNRLLGTVEAILDLSALEAGCVRFEQVPVRPRDLIADVVVDMQPMAAAKGLDLVSEVAGDLPWVEGDLEQLFRVMINLIDNAVKFSDGGVVAITATRGPEDSVEIEVRDSGIGIARENLDRIFERYFQERYKGQGAGVGLTICKRIVEAHGGRIWAESEGQGCGATLRLVLPGCQTGQAAFGQPAPRV